MRRLRSRYQFPHWNVARHGFFPTVTASGDVGIEPWGPGAAPGGTKGGFDIGSPTNWKTTPIYERQYAVGVPGHPSGSNAFFTDAGGANEISVPYGLYYGNVVAI